MPTPSIVDEIMRRMAAVERHLGLPVGPDRPPPTTRDDRRTARLRELLAELQSDPGVWGLGQRASSRHLRSLGYRADERLMQQAVILLRVWRGERDPDAVPDELRELADEHRPRRVSAGNPFAVQP